MPFSLAVWPAGREAVTYANGHLLASVVPVADWADLVEELDRWDEAGEVATFWWRDDDAAEHVASSARLLSLAKRLAVPVHLAVVPANETQALADAVNVCPVAWVLQHGYAHVNYAPKGEGAWELGKHRPPALVLAELADGFRRLGEVHAERFLPVLVPPWNRISRHLLRLLPQISFRAVSMFSARKKRYVVPGLEEVSTHCDPIKWKGGARFSGLAGALDDVVRHLAARRTREKDTSEPTGLLTHHLEMDAASWDFVEELISRTRDRPAARWVSLDTIVARAE